MFFRRSKRRRHGLTAKNLRQHMPHADNDNLSTQPTVNIKDDRPDYDSSSTFNEHGLRDEKTVASQSPTPTVSVQTARKKSKLTGLQRLKFYLAVTYWTTVVAIWALVFVISAVAYYAVTLPDPERLAILERPGMIKVLAASGETLAERGVMREHIPLKQLPQHLIDAVLSVEDKRFYQHFGFDLTGILRALVVNYSSGEIIQGGSTISQQLAKNLYFTSERTFARKLKEFIAALWLEVRLDKDKILEIYLNTVYYGGGAYGIEAATQHFFEKPAKDITLSESALLVGLLKAPSRFSPTYNLPVAQQRAKMVLNQMKELNKISEVQMHLALDKPANIVSRKDVYNLNYTIDWILRDLPAFLGAYQGDIVIQTSLDMNLQKLASATVRDFMQYNEKQATADQAAAIMLDKTGAVKALIGGRSYEKSQFNRALNAKRQPGSAFKPFIYLAALETGIAPRSVINDAPVNIRGWRPRNYGGRYRGPVSAQYALSKSINTVAVRLFRRAGAKRVRRTARRLGITSKLHNQPSLALGTAEVSLLELTSAYVPFANGGYGVFPHVIRNIQDANGKILYQRQGRGPGRVISKRHARHMNTMLRSVVSKGTGRRANFPGQVLAGKTGTSQNFRDAWFIGYSPYYTLGIWVGNDNNKGMRGVTGGSLPAAIWRHIMEQSHKELPSKAAPGVYAGF